jgi:hypothetical protein
VNFLFLRKLRLEGLKYWCNSDISSGLKSNILDIFCVSIRELMWPSFWLEKILLYQESVHLQIVIEHNFSNNEICCNISYI